MKKHTKGCKGFYETPDGRRWNRPGDIYALYIFKDRKWVKIGQYCTVCGVILNDEYKKASES